MPAWPDPTTFVLDGAEDDWAWLDSDVFGVKPGGIESAFGDHFRQGAHPDPNDFSATALYAWSPPPDNSFYFFARVRDDTLRALESKDNWWNDDSLQLQFDWDHGAGEWLLDFEDGYRLQFHPLGSNTEGAAAPSPPVFEEGPPHWGGQPPWTYVSTSIQPAGSGHNQPDVEYTYEIRVSPFATYSNLGADESTGHDLQAEQIVHFNFRFDDGDREEQGQQDLWVSVGDNFGCDRDGINCPDFVLAGSRPIFS